MRAEDFILLINPKASSIIFFLHNDLDDIMLKHHFSFAPGLCRDGWQLGNTTCYYHGCVGGIMDNGPELEFGEPSSNYLIWVHYITYIQMPLFRCQILIG